jgi:metallo-beta-lactamase class B
MRLLVSLWHSAPISTLGVVWWMRRYAHNLLAASFCFLLTHAAAQTPPALEKLADGVYMFTTYLGTGKDLIPANGLLVRTPQGLVMVDTGSDTASIKTVLQLARQATGQNVTLAIVTHAHNDRYGGAEALAARKIKAVATVMTARLCQSAGIDGILPELAVDTTLTIGGTPLQIWYPGPGHAPDNIVVYVPQAKVLFGGCFVKSAGSKDLGNLADADLPEWSTNLKRVYDRYKNAAIVVPGHGPAGGPELLGHTQKLLNAALPKAQSQEDEQE